MKAHVATDVHRRRFGNEHVQKWSVRRCTSGPDAPVDCNNEAIARLPLRYHHRQFRCTTRASSCTESQRNAFHPSRCSGVRATRIIKKFKKNNNNLPPYCGTCSSSRGAESMCTAPLCSGKHARLPFPRQYKNGVVKSRPKNKY